ncbi:von Willebrand factor A domain-containing protein 5A [Armadillidium nasatum]|uniref:von Willebrand factor A domain-containing protein 5A n=1 Tax=Armadillidium nasatum TaxID=96803 RepID=A0A5N5TME2_9CRUS|nr:von Willebrand factor A domain-containing protein 5A [Armadillidium nasatum]
MVMPVVSIIILYIYVKTAVYSFNAKLDGRSITGHCMEKKKAKEVYDNAVKEGHTAILGSEDRFSGDLLHLALGNLPKGEYANLQLKMVQELPLKIDGAVDFTLPTVFNPRYSPADQSSGPEYYPPALENYVTPNKSPYSLKVKAEVQGSFKITNIKSLTDQINVHISDDETSATITQDDGMNFDQDWSFQIYYQTVHKPHCLQMAGDRTSTGLMKDDVLMLNLFPEVPLEDYSPFNEIILVVDRSGSMEGSKIVKAKNTLLLFLKSLPPGCRFNVVSFGSDFETLFESSSERYTESTLQKALELQKSMDADMGGTEIYEALRHVYSKELVPGYPRQIIVLTDGEVWNIDQLIELIQRHADDTRVFSVGIGDGASTALVEGMAMAGKGRCEMVADESQFQTRVMGLIGSMLQENVTVDLTVECKVAPPQEVKLVPKVAPNVFGGQHLILYARLKPNSKIESVKVGWKIGEDQFNCELKEDDCKSVHDSNFSFHRLAAKAQLIQWLKEDDDNLHEDIINLSISSSVVCKLTSFVGFDQDNKVIKEKAREYPTYPEMDAAVCCMMSAPMGKSLCRIKKNKSATVALESYDQALIPCDTSADFMEYEDEDEGSEFLRCGFVGGGNGPPSEENDALVEQEKDTLVDLISFQQFDGSWSLNDCLNLLNIDEKFCETIRSKVSLDDICLGTALILSYLELKFDARKEEWKIVALKGHKFLKVNKIDSAERIKYTSNILATQI